MEINITWNICRVCLQEELKNTKSSSSGGPQMVALFDNDSKLAKQIYECSGITMKPSDSLPEKICRKCVTILKYAVNFRKTCRDSNIYLQSILQRTRSASALFKPSNNFEDETEDPFSYNEAGDETEDTEEEVEINQKRKIGNSFMKPSKKVKHASTSSSGMEVVKEKVNHVELNTNEDNSVHEENAIHHHNINNKLEVEDNNGERISAQHDDKVDMEEFLENPDEIMDQMFINMTKENLTTNEVLIEDEEDAEEEGDDIEEHDDVSNKNKQFYANDNFTNLPNDNLLNKIIIENSQNEDHEGDSDMDIIEKSETEQSLKQDNEEDFYYILKDMKNEITVSKKTDDQSSLQHNDENINESDVQEIVDDDVDFTPLENQAEQQDEDENYDEEEGEEDDDDDEEEDNLMLHLDNGLDDNQAQVTSTVVTREDVEFNEENSNLTNVSEILTEYVIDEFEDSNSNNSSMITNTATSSISNEKRTISKSSTNTIKNSSNVILPQRRSKHNSSSNIAGGTCSLCGNHFISRQLLNIHMKIHRQEKNHECEICFKRFITACNLQAHMRIHTGEKPFECQYCGRRFSDRSSNLRHERIHTNEKPFKCELCGKTFSLTTTLHAHLKVHTGERLYRCEPCAKSFKLPHQLKAHQSTSLHKAVLQLGKLH